MTKYIICLFHSQRLPEASPSEDPEKSRKEKPGGLIFDSQLIQMSVRFFL